MENNSSITNYMEKYVIDELKQAKIEVKRLTSLVDSLKEENFKLSGGNGETFSIPALGVSYSIQSYNWYIKKDNLSEYKRALAEKDISWLSNHNYEIRETAWNYEIHVGSNVLKLNIYPMDGKLNCYAVDDDKAFSSREDAEVELLKVLSEDIVEREDKITKEENMSNA